MSRGHVWVGVLIAGGLSIVAARAQQSGDQPRQAVRAIQPLTETLYVIPASDRNTYPIGGYVPDDSVRNQTTGGNTAVWVTEEGVVLVDTMNPGSGAEKLAQVRSVTDKPVTTIINTHTHFDHSGSNTEFSDTVQFVAHENIRASMAQGTCDPVINCQAFQGENAKFFPAKTFSKRMTLFDGADRVELYHFGRGHTNGDTWVVFPAARAIHTGDMFQQKNMPFVDAENGGGDAREFADTLNRVAATIGDVDTIIAGHSRRRWLGATSLSTRSTTVNSSRACSNPNGLVRALSRQRARMRLRASFSTTRRIRGASGRMRRRSMRVASELN